MEFTFISELRWNSVILPMVLQIRGTMVLQRIKLEGKGSLPHFCVFGPSAAPTGEAWFRRKTSQKVEIVA